MDGPSATRGLIASGNPDRYLLESETLRRRQLCAAFLHGTRRGWRDRRRVWPAALAGVVIVAVIIAAIGVANAFARQSRLNSEQHRVQSAGSVQTWSTVASKWATASAVRPAP